MNEKEVGFLGIKILNDQVVYLKALYLDPQYIGKKIGSSVMDQLIRRYQSLGYREMVLLVHKDAFWAIKFYEFKGFTGISCENGFICQYKNGLLKNHLISNTILYTYKLT